MDTVDADREPSEQIRALLKSVQNSSIASIGMRIAMEREREFPSSLAAKLTGIALDPYGRGYADKSLDAYWADPARQAKLLNDFTSDRDVIIGAGIHAATYAATRVLSGFPRPLVLERSPRVGGTMAMTSHPTFFLNSRNRPGVPGLAGDQGASLNYIPGAPIQASSVSMREYQTNTDLAFVVRLTLAQYADVVPNSTVIGVTSNPSSGASLDIELEERGPLRASRIIDARGLGDPKDAKMSNGKTVITFNEFMTRMENPWPLRGIRRIAVIGGGDSGKVTVEALLGIGPQPMMAAASLDTVERIDWYSTQLTDDCEEWTRTIRGRYQSIGRYLRPDRFGFKRLNVIKRTAFPTVLPGGAFIDGRTYDLVVMATGNAERPVGGLGATNFDNYSVGPAPLVVATKHYGLPIFRVGPLANIPWQPREVEDGVSALEENRVSIFRLASKTAVLASSLPRNPRPTVSDSDPIF